MTNKFKNRVGRITYRPSKRTPNRDFIFKRLGEVEDALLILLGKKRRNKK
ncbi:MAG: hypothetical protein FWE33_03655 [Defluviitaleaceae bacterium]|nr:hypothetical protein [Defluviitaleaceae bacterium]